MSCPEKVYLGDNLVFGICTHDPDTGVLTNADSNPSYRLYEDETPTPILTGTMTRLDDSNTTGFYTELIACTTANGFEDRKTYTIYIEATVDTDKGGIPYAFRALTPPPPTIEILQAKSLITDVLTSGSLITDTLSAKSLITKTLARNSLITKTLSFKSVITKTLAKESDVTKTLEKDSPIN